MLVGVVLLRLVEERRTVLVAAFFCHHPTAVAVLAVS